MLPDMQYSFVARNGDVFSFFRTSRPGPSAQQIDQQNALLKQQMKVEVRNSKYSNEYNCHGLTFISKLGRFSYFNDEVSKLLIAHDYTYLGGTTNYELDPIIVSSKVLAGDVIVYLDNNIVQHTGIVWSARKSNGELKLKILSKWGDMSEYFHDYKVVPQPYGKTIQIWTDRRI